MSFITWEKSSVLDWMYQRVAARTVCCSWYMGVTPTKLYIILSYYWCILMFKKKFFGKHESQLALTFIKGWYTLYNPWCHQSTLGARGSQGYIVSLNQNKWFCLDIFSHRRTSFPSVAFALAFVWIHHRGAHNNWGGMDVSGRSR